MNKTILTSAFVFGITLFFLIGVSFLINSQPVQAADPPKNYIVTFKDHVSESVVSSTFSDKNIPTTKLFPKIGVAVLKTNDEKLIESLRQDPNVDGVDLEKGMPVPGYTWKQPILPAMSNLMMNFTDPMYVASQWHIRRVYADQAWSAGYTASHNTVVGVVDTGVANNHPDLSGNIVYEECFTSYQPTCTPYPSIPAALQGNHGTLVAGPIASLINNEGGIGVAPNVGLANYNVGEIGPDGIPIVYDSSIFAAMEDAGEQGIDALNFSFSYIIPVPMSQEDRRRVRNYREALRQANQDKVMIIAAAGNNSTNLDDESTLVIPCELPHVTCVAATNIRPEPVFPQTGFYDEQTFYTGYGEAIDIAAPGGDCGGPDLPSCFTAPDPRYFVWTTNVASDPTCAVTQSCPTAYTANIGTSLAVPHVVGAAALIMDIYKTETGNELRPNQVERILQNTADPIQDNPPIGPGVVNAKAAVDRVLEMVD